MATTSPRLALVAPESTDPDDVPGYIAQLRDQLDEVVLDRRGGDTITASGAAVIPLVVKGAAGQTANLLEARNDAGTVVASLGPSGRINFGPALSGASVAVTSPDPTDKGLVVRGAASQAANLAEFQNSAGAVLTSVSANGTVRVNPQTSLYLGPDIANTHVGFTANAPSIKPLVVRGAASQTANLAEFQNSAGTVLQGVDASGRSYYGSPLFTSAALGAYFGKVAVNIDGNIRYIPAYL